MAETFEFRQLTADDFFPMCTIISKLGAKEIGRCFENPAVMAAINGEGKFDIESVGITVMADIAASVLSHMEECKLDLYRFIASLSGMPVADIASMRLARFAAMVITLFKREDFRDFFTEVSMLLKQGTSDSLT